MRHFFYVINLLSFVAVSLNNHKILGMKKLVVGFYLSLLMSAMISCGGRDDEQNQRKYHPAGNAMVTQTQKKVSDYKQQALDIMGLWYLNEWDLYHTIRFIDKQRVEFDTHIDTILTYDYEIRPDSLIIYNEGGDRLYINLIEKLSRDTLVFKNLMEKVGSQRYSRKRSKTLGK